MIEEYIVPVIAVIGALQIAVSHIAPHTKTELDDKAAGWLKTIHSLFQKIAGNYGNAKNEKVNKDAK